jgi:hypothetical protein
VNAFDNADCVIPSAARNLLLQSVEKADSSAKGLGMTIVKSVFQERVVALFQTL